MKNYVILGPGQAAQYIGMGKTFYETSDICKNIFISAEKITGVDVRKLSFEGPEDILTRTDNVQVCITTVSIASLEYLKNQKNINIIATAGHSLGEYTALFASGVFDLETVLKAVQIRGKLMQEAADKYKGGMLAVIGMKLEKIQELTDELAKEGIINIANLNSPKQIILSGEEKMIKKAAERFKEAGAKKVVPLNVSGAWHSKLMETAAEGMKNFLDNVTLNPPKLPIFSNVTTQQYSNDPSEIKALLVKQIISPVNWIEEFNNIKNFAGGNSVENFQFLELAPNKILAGINKQNDRSIPTISFDNPELINEI